jgi:hypothetical protein
MREMDFIPEVVAEIGARWAEIEKRFNQEKEHSKRPWHVTTIQSDACSSVI